MPSHWSLRSSNVVSHSSPVATQACHASAIGLAIKLSRKDQVVLTTIGEGSTAQGEWYEAVNWAAIHKLPVIFLVENNVYAISVRQDKQMAVASAAEKAAGLGLPGASIDGLDPIAMHTAVLQAAERARRGEGPTLLEARVHRLTPHSSDDDDRSYRPRQEVEAMKSEDPLTLFHDQFLFGLDLALTSFEQLHKDSLVELPGSVLIGISQSRTTGGADAQMFQFAFTASQLPGNLPERMGSAQLTEEHGHKLAPTSEPSGMTFDFCLFHSLLELDSELFALFGDSLNKGVC